MTSNVARKKLGWEDDASVVSEGSEGDGGELGSPDPDSTTGDRYLSPKQERDEVKEIEKQNKKETNRIHFWRGVVTIVLLSTAVVVTFTTWRFLVHEQTTNYETAYAQFANTVKSSLIQHQIDTRQALTAFSNDVTRFTQNTNVEWPFFSLPQYETAARDVLDQARSETIVVLNKVKHEQRAAWEEYSNDHYQQWIEEGHLYHHGNLDNLKPVGWHPYITQLEPNGTFVPADDTEVYFPFWSVHPPPLSYGPINRNVDYIGIDKALMKLRHDTVVSDARPYPWFLVYTEEEHDVFHSKLPGNPISSFPHSFWGRAVLENSFDPDAEVVAIVITAIGWDRALLELLPEGVEGIQVVLKSTCDQVFTFELIGPDAVFLGEGDQHDTAFDSKEVIADLSFHTDPEFLNTPGHCIYDMHIYPTKKFESSYRTSTPERFAIVVACTFVMVALVFVVYDIFVQHRNTKIVHTAATSNALVSNMFPDHIRDKLIERRNLEEANNRMSHRFTRKSQMKSFLDGNTDGMAAGSQPLADLFVDTTVMMADITGFTAWASVREPSQVFALLETVYEAFDAAAAKRRVFKVETVGDCYVAVAGMPEPRKDHAIAMARFAHTCLRTFKQLAHKLELTLGPDTGDLNMRIGLHSGPVTAGVLRGERARFQLFGDTMNVTARMEQTCRPGMIQLSNETADLINSSGRGHWLDMRPDPVEAKGKGQLRTFWLKGIGGTQSSVNSVENGRHGVTITGMDPRTTRLINWNVETLARLLKQIIARRDVTSTRTNSSSKQNLEGKPDYEKLRTGETFLDEWKEIIELPEYDAALANQKDDPDNMDLSPAVVSELRDYVTCIAAMYHENAFHNFEHASHVVMSTIKLLSRIVAPSELEQKFEATLRHEGTGNSAGNIMATLHDHTYGITSDPLTQFACAFSALIHDVDHVGVPNTRLVEENATIATLYKGRSVAEQNSLALAWNLLMDDRFCQLRDALFSNQAELKRFRELVVNSVLATDISDKDLKSLRNGRWAKAFEKSTPEESSPLAGRDNARDVKNRKATIVIEHLIQASDVSHTMQHWHVYRKWNERLFEEMYRAYRAGRSTTNPKDFWAKGEIGFFDFYIIPLAKKLKECGVFGVSSDEYLNYAIANRREWEMKGEAVVAEMMEKFNKKDFAAPNSDQI